MNKSKSAEALLCIISFVKKIFTPSYLVSLYFFSEIKTTLLHYVFVLYYVLWLGISVCNYCICVLLIKPIFLFIIKVWFIGKKKCFIDEAEYMFFSIKSNLCLPHVGIKSILYISDTYTCINKTKIMFYR